MGRSPCCNVDGLKRGAWTAEEDQKLIAYIQEHGEGGWRTLPHKAGLQRCGKSCRLRWANYLRPDIKRGEFSPEEEERIVELHASLGNRWSAIARHVPKRTDNEIKNYWNTHLKKRLSEKGIDPTTHKPISTASSSSSDAAVPSISTNHDTPSAPPGDRHVSSSSASAQLLNKLAAKLAPYSSSLHGDEVEAPNSKRSTSNSSSSSAKLLNKMASRLAHPLHCLNTLKSILSAAATSSLSESTAASRSISNSSNDLPAQTASCQQDDDQVAFLENVDLDVLNVWQHQHEQQQYGVVEQPSDAVVMDFLGDSSITTSSEKEGHQPYHYNYHQDSMFPASQYGRDDDLTLGGPHADLDDLFGTCGGMFRGEADHDEHHHHQYMDFDGPSTSASRNNDQRTLDHDNYDYAVDDDQQYAHRQFEYQHGAGGLLDGDDEHGRTFFNNYGDFHIDAPALF